RIVPSKAPLPILSGLLIRTTDDHHVEIIANDMELSIRCLVDAQVIEPGSIVLPARFFGEIVRRLPDGTIHLKVNGPAFIAEIQGERLEMELNGMDPMDFPSAPQVDQLNPWVVEQGKLRRAIGQVDFAISTDESRPAMTGALLRMAPGDCSIVAMDGFRFAERKMDTPATEGRECIIPGKTLNDLVKLLNDDDTPVNILIGSNHITFSFERVTLSSRLIEAQFPFKRAADLIRVEPTTIIRSSVKNLSEGIDRALLVTRDSATSSNIVRLQFSDSTLTISSNSPDVGRLNEVIAVAQEGDELLIGFNGRYLNDILKAVGSDEIECRFSGPLKAAVFVPVGESSFISILSPIRI
ncbi:MAG: DNA polymerase III subunit beta, partial [Bacillota bacterium]